MGFQKILPQDVEKGSKVCIENNFNCVHLKLIGTQYKKIF